MMKQIGDKYRKVPNADEERRYGIIRDGFIKLGFETCVDLRRSFKMTFLTVFSQSSAVVFGYCRL